jgi:hypothetical protein
VKLLQITGSQKVFLSSGTKPGKMGFADQQFTGAWEHTLSCRVLHQRKPDGWTVGGKPILAIIAFYEKVIKVKADVAAYLINCFPSA